MKWTGQVNRRTALKSAGATLVGSLAAFAGCMGGGGSDSSENQTASQTEQSTEAETAPTTGAEATAGSETTGGGSPGSATMQTGAESTMTGAVETIKLGGKIPGWQGQTPSAIQGKTNPTLSLEPGTTYRLTWVNLDGAEHELIIEDRNGNEITATESASKKGVTRSITFTATKKMAQYYCEYHPQSMRGNIEFGGSKTTVTGTQATDSATTSGDAGY